MRDADLVLSVKEVPLAQLGADKTYMMFSHTHKGQLHNMPMLQTILDRVRVTCSPSVSLTDGRRLTSSSSHGCVRRGGRRQNIRLIDYELLKDPKTNQRLVRFGEFAGFAGAFRVR